MGKVAVALCERLANPWDGPGVCGRAPEKFFGRPITGKQSPKNVYVTVQGVAFFDLIHGQTGVAPNGIELHPILHIDLRNTP